MQRQKVVTAYMETADTTVCLCSIATGRDLEYRRELRDIILFVSISSAFKVYNAITTNMLTQYRT